MTTLYRPVLIESAEQAEALPIGTYAVLWNTCRIAVKVRAVQWDAESGSYGNRDMLMAEALVPIEAEEEYTTSIAQERWDVDAVYDSPENVRRDGWDDPLETRLVTPWTPTSG